MFLQFLTDFNRLFGEVHLVGEADEHSAFGREEGTCGFLALVVIEGVVVGEAEHFDYDDRSAYASLSPPKTKPCSRKHQDETVRKSSPQGVTIPNAKRASLRPPEFAQTVFTCHFYDLLHNGTDCNTPCECNDLHSCNCKLVHSSFSDLKMNEDSK